MTTPATSQPIPRWVSASQSSAPVGVAGFGERAIHLHLRHVGRRIAAGRGNEARFDAAEDAPETLDDEIAGAGGAFLHGAAATHLAVVTHEHARRRFAERDAQGSFHFAATIELLFHDDVGAALLKLEVAPNIAVLRRAERRRHRDLLRYPDAVEIAVGIRGARRATCFRPSAAVGARRTAGAARASVDRCRCRSLRSYPSRLRRRSPRHQRHRPVCHRFRRSSRRRFRSSLHRSTVRRRRSTSLPCPPVLRRRCTSRTAGGAPPRPSLPPAEAPAFPAAPPSLGSGVSTLSCASQAANAARIHSPQNSGFDALIWIDLSSYRQSREPRLFVPRRAWPEK